MKPATILSESEGRRLHKLATNIISMTEALLNGKPKRRRRRKAKAEAKAKATATPKVKKSAKQAKAKSYPVESTTN